MADSSNDLARAGLPQTLIAVGATVAIALHLLWQPLGLSGSADWPLLVALILGGGYLVFGLLVSSGSRASSARTCWPASPSSPPCCSASTWPARWSCSCSPAARRSRRTPSAGRRRRSTALARRMPSVAHRKPDGTVADVPLDEVAVGDLVVVFPHETCPVDGVVVEGHGTMDESYLTGEPYLLSKAPGSAVLSGAINGDAALDDPGRAAGGRFAVRQDHAGDAGVGAAAAAAAAARRPARGGLHAARRRHRPGRLGRQRRPGPVPGRAGGRHAVPAADRHPGGDHRLRVAGGPARHHHQGPGRAGEDRHRAGRRSSTRPARSPTASRR